jgi:hypothetical protein
MKKKITLKLVLAVLLLAIIWTKWHEHTALVCPNKPVWKTITAVDYSNLDTSFTNFYQHHSLVHPKMLVWKESIVDDSANYHQQTLR